jgi:hypothetical protein
VLRIVRNHASAKHEALPPFPAEEFFLSGPRKPFRRESERIANGSAEEHAAESLFLRGWRILHRR